MFCCPLQGSLTLLATGGTLTAGDGVIAAATSTLQNAATWQAFLLSRAAVCALPAGSKRALQDALTLWLASYFGDLFLLIWAGRFAHLTPPPLILLNQLFFSIYFIIPLNHCARQYCDNFHARRIWVVPRLGIGDRLLLRYNNGIQDLSDNNPLRA